MGVRGREGWPLNCVEKDVSQLSMTWQMRLLAYRAFPLSALRDQSGLLRQFLIATSCDGHLLWGHVREQIHTCATPSRGASAAPGKFEVKSHGSLSHSNDCKLFPLTAILPQTSWDLLFDGLLSYYDHDAA
jgi:hypothetical protein